MGSKAVRCGRAWQRQSKLSYTSLRRRLKIERCATHAECLFFSFSSQPVPGHTVERDLLGPRTTGNDRQLCLLGVVEWVFEGGVLSKPEKDGLQHLSASRHDAIRFYLVRLDVFSSNSRPAGLNAPAVAVAEGRLREIELDRE